MTGRASTEVGGLLAPPFSSRPTKPNPAICKGEITGARDSIMPVGKITDDWYFVSGVDVLAAAARSWRSAIR
jgi:hypothetical protein